MKRFYFSLLIFALMLWGNSLQADDDFWKPRTESGSFGIDYNHFLSDLFPQGLVEGQPRDLTLFSFKGSVKGLTCGQPGIVFDLSIAVATLSQLESYLLSHVQAMLQAAPLLMADQLFPELATLMKHFNDLGLQKIDLQAATCESIMRDVRSSQLIAPQRPYVVCINEKMEDGTDRDRAEVECGNKTEEIENFLEDNKVVKSFDLWDATIKHAKKKRIEEEHFEMPSDERLDLIHRIIGEMRVEGEKGVEAKQGDKTFKEWVNSQKAAAQAALEALVAECQGEFYYVDDVETPQNHRKYCTITDAQLTLYDPELAEEMPNKAEPHRFLTKRQIMAIASIDDDALLANYLDYVATEISLRQGELLIHQFEKIANVALGEAGSETYKEVYENKKEELKSELQELKDRFNARVKLHNDLQRMATAIRPDYQQKVNPRTPKTTTPRVKRFIPQ